jgi:hypothetical protein
VRVAATWNQTAAVYAGIRGRASGLVAGGRDTAEEGPFAAKPPVLLGRVVAPLTIQSWSLTSLQQRLFKTGGRLIRHARYCILQTGRKPLDEDRHWADPRAHRAARVASDVVERAARTWSRLGVGGSVPPVGGHGQRAFRGCGISAAGTARATLVTRGGGQQWRIERSVATRQWERRKLVHIAIPG